ncbi:MAG: hypothetical protein UU96_C0011G0001 [Parcubacteria group bacterium GW2011_GWC2_42_13]|nr:MAG: hypothetical protein UU96_C0011G0001 [Parcubacteria group bacterium GW2011_GWC2_42_13]
MRKTAVLGMIMILFLAGCGTLYIEGASSFTGPILNRDLTEKPSVTIQWLNGKNVMVTSGRDSSSFCDSGVVGHTLENWLGLRGAQPVVRKDTAEYEIMVYSDHDRSGYWSSITTVRAWECPGHQQGRKFGLGVSILGR